MTPTARAFCYEILLQGPLEQRWLRWFEGLEIDQRLDGETLIKGVMDQSALHGILNVIRDLGMELFSVQRMPVPEENRPGAGSSLTDDQLKDKPQ